MRIQKSCSRRARDDRGSTVVVVALSMTALLGIVAMAVDVGMLLTARAEAQRAADAGALAGASELILDPDGEAAARTEAEQFAQANTVQNVAVDVDPAEDVDVDLDNSRVTVRVRRDAARGGPIVTWFANVFGVENVNVSAEATAEAAPGGSAVCVKPFAVPDRFQDVDGDGLFEPGDGDSYDPAVHGYGSSWRNDGQPGSDGQGYENDLGRPVVIKGGGPGAAGGGPGGGGPPGGGGAQPGTGPSWYYPWDIPQIEGGTCAGGPGGQGASCYQWAIENCHPGVISVGEEYMVATGVMHGPTGTGITNLINQDPWAVWDNSSQSVVNSAWNPWGGSPRIAVVPTFNPAREFDPGKQPIEFSNFIAVFVESVQGNGTFQEVHGRVLYVSGMGGGTATAPGLKYVRLVR